MDETAREGREHWKARTLDAELTDREKTSIRVALAQYLTEQGRWMEKEERDLFQRLLERFRRER